MKKYPCICDNGKQKITCSESGKPDSSFKMDCMWCNGKGFMSEQEHAGREYFINAWCKCGNPSGQVDYYEHEHSHGYTCVDCGKIVQTG